MLVVGAVRGLGAAHARGFHAEGAYIVIGDMHVTEGQQLAAELGDRAVFVRMNPDCPDDWERAMKVAEQRFGKVSMVINSAGISDRGAADYEP